MKLVLLLPLFCVPLCCQAQHELEKKVLSDFLEIYCKEKDSSFLYLHKFTSHTALPNSFPTHIDSLCKFADTRILNQIKTNQSSFKNFEWKCINSHCFTITASEKLVFDGEVIKGGRIFFVTMPIFDDSKSYAILHVSSGIALSRSRGAYCLLKKEGEKWAILCYFPEEQ